MSNWARRMHRRAATLSNVVTSCGHPNSLPYPRRLEKVKFGVPLHEVCKDDIPGPLLVSIYEKSLELAYWLRLYTNSMIRRNCIGICMK